MSEVEKLVQIFRREEAKTEAFFSQLPEDVWEVQLYADGAEWCVREVFAHIIQAESAYLLLAEDIRSGGSGVAEKFDIDEYNAKAVAELSKHSPQELLAEFKTNRMAMIKFITSLTEEDLARIGNNPFLNQASLAEMLRLLYLHINLHIRDIRKAVGT